jgi:tetratricopeptide (TPR) repeat protein
LKLFNSDRCKICRKRKGNRFCIRVEGNICWNDCNILRVDLKCSQNCRYALKKNQRNGKGIFFEFKTNADSQTEFTDLLKKEIDKWITSPQDFWNNKTPAELAETEEGKQQITTFFNSFTIPEYVPMQYLKRRLNLADLKIHSLKKNFETVAAEYLDLIISYEWDKTFELVNIKNKFADKDLWSNYLNRITSDKILKKMKHYDLISSALAEGKKTGIVFLEINGRYEISLILELIGTDWFVIGRIYGKPELYNGENEAVKQIAILLSSNKINEVFPLLKKYSAIFPDSADLHYYWGLYYTFSNNKQNAEEFFLNAVEIDSDFTEAKYNYAYVLHSQKKYTKAKDLYREILNAEPEEIKSMNNLASIHIDQGDYSAAKKLLDQCLEINSENEIARKNLERLETLNP